MANQRNRERGGQEAPPVPSGPRVYNNLLTKALYPYMQVPGLIGGVTSALGLHPGEHLSVEQHPVLGFYMADVDPETAQSFSVSLLTPRSFTLFRMPLGAGSALDSSTVTIPLSRVTRVSETNRSYTQPVGAGSPVVMGVVSVLVEFDADLVILRSNLEHVEEVDLQGPEGLDRRVGRSAMNAELARSTYELVSEFDATANPEGTLDTLNLREFARCLRNAVE